MIQHVTRVVAPSQLQECVDFYEMIGFESVPVPPGLTGSALWLERHGTQIHLMPADDAHPAPGHVGVVVASYDDTLARLRDEGYEVNPRPEHWGSPRCFARDPAGNVVELMAWPPGASGPAVAQGDRPT